MATPSAPCPELALPECTNCFGTKGCLMSPSAPWLCTDSLWHGDQNCQCFLSQQWQNVVMSCTPGEVLVRRGHVRGARFQVPSSQGDCTFTSPKAFAWYGACHWGWWVPLQSGEPLSTIQKYAIQQLGVEPQQGGPHPEQLFMNNECRTW